MFGVGRIGTLGSPSSGGGLPWWLPLAGGVAPTYFADFRTEGSTGPRYWFNGLPYLSFSAWNTAVSATYARAQAVNYTKSGLIVSANSGVARFPTTAAGVPTGLRLTGAQTELTLWNRDLTNAAWTATTATVAKDQTGADGAATSASSILATAGNATVLQAITSGSAARTMGAWVKRLTGSGVINITQDNGGTWTPIVPTGSWAFYQLPTATLANPTVGFQIVTSGDAIAVDFVTERSAVFLADPIATTTVSVAQTADAYQFPFAQTVFTALVITQNQIANTGSPRIIGLDSGGSDTPIFINTSTKFSEFSNSVSLAGPVVGSNVTNLHKTAVSGSGAATRLTSDGLAAVTNANRITSATPTTFILGAAVAGGNPAYGDIALLAIWNGVMGSVADLQRLTL